MTSARTFLAYAVFSWACACGGGSHWAPASASAPPAESNAQPTQASTESSPAVAPVAEIHQLDPETLFGSYRGRAAEWVPGVPLAVNREFDFNMALTLDGAGAGLAAAKRNKANRATAQTLGELLGADLYTELSEIARTAEHVGRSSTVRIYAILFGEERARLEVFLDVASESAHPVTYAHVSEARPLEGQGSWASMDEDALAAGFKRGVRTVLELCDDLPDSPPPSEGQTHECPVGGNVTVKGTSVARLAQGPVLQVLAPREHWLACPDAERIQDSDDLAPR